MKNGIFTVAECLAVACKVTGLAIAVVSCFCTQFPIFAVVFHAWWLAGCKRLITRKKTSPTARTKHFWCGVLRLFIAIYLNATVRTQARLKSATPLLTIYPFSLYVWHISSWHTPHLQSFSKV